jgi:hypothetical protein
MKTLAKNAIGVIIRVTIKSEGGAADISSATKKQIRLILPSGNTMTFSADFVTDGVDGGLQYVTSHATDLNESGTYKICCYVEMTGYSGYTLDADGFIVK